MKPWYMVFNPYPDGKKPTIRHESLNEAEIESFRVATLTGKKCHVLKCIGTAYPPETMAVYKAREG